MERLRITIEFNKKNKDDIELFKTLQLYSSPPAYVKDVLKGLLPIPRKIKFDAQVNEFNDDSEDDEDLMDI